MDIPLDMIKFDISSLIIFTRVRHMVSSFSPHMAFGHVDGWLSNGDQLQDC